MKNKEKCANEIVEVASKGIRIAFDKNKNKIVPCIASFCNNCAFDGENCRKKTEEWANAEYEEPKITIPADTPVDAKVLVSHDGRAWFRRYFARFSDGYVLTWYFGATSWSICDAADPTAWEYGKLAEEENE